MASAFREENQKLFPLKSISDVVRFFGQHLQQDHEPDLTLLSIITGMIENTLTSGRVSESNQHVGTTGGSTAPASVTTTGNSKFPVVQFDTVEVLYKKFQTILTAVDVKHSKSKINYASREIIKKVSDVIWNSLIRSSYKDRAHLQSLFSYLSGSKLDCFGVAFAVVAGCQMLGFSDVHLAISEDHAWLVFGKNRDNTIEVTWHGKGSEDKRGQPISAGIQSHSWIYLSGYPVVCNRHMEVVALVLAINPHLSQTSACLEVTELQQQLLWLLYDFGHLERYPMGLGNLGELEEMSPTSNRPTSEELYAESVKSARKFYKNHHVYPYTYQGAYYYRQNMYKDAFAAWANAGDVIRLYIYSRDDEEIYKELLDIANEHIPLIMKTESSGHSARSILRDPQCFANLLRFYDGICQWEEGSLTPILHIGWAKPLVNTISKFDYDIRSQVIINCANDDEDNQTQIIKNEAKQQAAEEEEARCIKQITTPDLVGLNNNNINNNNILTKTSVDNKDILNGSKGKEKKSDNDVDESSVADNGRSEGGGDGSDEDGMLPPMLEALTAACGEKILNPDFLLQGGGQPFTETQQGQNEAENSNEKIDEELIEGGEGSITAKSSPLASIVAEDEKNEKTKSEAIDEIKTIITKTEIEGPKYEPRDDDYLLIPKRPLITLYSQKMKGLKDLLLAEKLNTQAISLQVTAQSQVGGKKARHNSSSFTGGHQGSGGSNLTGMGGGGGFVSGGTGSSEVEGSSRPKRSRRE